MSRLLRCLIVHKGLIVVPFRLNDAKVHPVWVKASVACGVNIAVPFIGIRVVGIRISADDFLVEALDVEGCETFAPKLNPALPPNLVLERFGVIAVIAFGMLAIFEIRIAQLCESSQELLASCLILHAGSLCFYQHHLFNSHHRDCHHISGKLVCMFSILRAELDLETAYYFGVRLASSGKNTLWNVGISRQGFHFSIICRQLIYRKVNEAFLPEVSGRNRFIEVTVYALRSSVISSLAHS